MRGKTTTRGGFGRLLGRLTALFLALCLLTGQALGAGPSLSNLGSSYKSGPYYQKLLQVELTGNQITDLIAVAASQLGYHESNSKSDLTGTGSGSGNCTEYGRFTNTNGQAWCASFVSWCFRKANIPTSIMPTSAGVGGLRRSVYNNGAVWHSVDSGYTPKAGDLVLYESMDGNYTYYQYASRDSKGVPSKSSHVGIVVSDYDASSKTYCTIEGNGSQGNVKYLTGQKLYMAGPTKGGGTMNRIQGFVTPAYTTGSGASYDGSRVDTTLTVTLTTPTDPTYTAKQAVSGDNATVVTRISKTAGSHITQSGLILSYADGTTILDHREKVTNVRDTTTVFHAWYDIQDELGIALDPGTTYRYQFYAVVNGKTFYGNTYTFTTTGSAPSYTLRFDPAGGSVSPTSKTVTARNVAGDLPIPTREGYVFLGWYTSGGSIYSASQIVTASLTLTARWTQEQEGELDAPMEDTPPAEDLPFSMAVLNSVNSLGQVEIDKDAAELRLQLRKPEGVGVGLFRVRYYDGQDLIATVEKDFSGDSDLANMVDATITVHLDQNFPDYSAQKDGAVYSFDWYVEMLGESLSGPVSQLVITGGGEEAPAEQFTVTFLDLGNMTSYGELVQTNGTPFQLPDPPTRSGWTFEGWKLNGTLLTERTTVSLTGDATAYASWSKAQSAGTSFSDVVPGSWYDQAVTWAVDQGITNGTGAATFSPERTCSRAEIITFLWRAAGAPETVRRYNVWDVDADQYYFQAVQWAAEQNIIPQAGAFDPDAPCTRLMAVDFMWKYAGSPNAPLAGFADVSSGAVDWAVSQGVTNGTGANRFSPEVTCTRAQIVTFLYRGFAG